jgi:hypothetical protein
MTVEGVRRLRDRRVGVGLAVERLEQTDDRINGSSREVEPSQDLGDRFS